jgi:mRNA interferase MazF
MVEQTSAVDPETRLGEFAGRLTAEEMLAVDRTLTDVLGLQ